MDVDWAILADAAQVVGGKLYLLGGGWDVLTANTALPLQQQCGIALGFGIPWTEANQRQRVELEIQHEDGQSLMRANLEIEVGRPSGLPPGSTQRAQSAVNLAIKLHALGTYVLIVRLDSEERKRVPFRVIAGPRFPRGRG